MNWLDEPNLERRAWLILAERDRLPWWRWRRRRMLAREFHYSIEMVLAAKGAAVIGPVVSGRAWDDAPGWEATTRPARYWRNSWDSEWGRGSVSPRMFGIPIVAVEEMERGVVELRDSDGIVQATVHHIGEP